MEFLKMKNSAQFLTAAMQSPARSRPLSIRQLSRKLGYASDRTVGMVFKGQRKMSADMQERLVKWLKLTPKEQLYLHSLVRYERGKTRQEPPAAVVLAPVKYTMTALPSGQLHPLVPAYALVILELLRISGGHFSAKDIGSRLRQKIDALELHECLEGLLQAGLIRSDREGFYRGLEEDEFVTTTCDIPSSSIRENHRRQLQRAADSLDEQSTADREFNSKTIAVARERLPEIKRRIRDMLEELSDEIAQIGPDSESVVAQLNLQFYLQSK
jgi:uncharacterized protein (TIGR02147 family)